MDETTSFLQQSSHFDKNVVAPNMRFDYMKAQMQDFEEFGPGFCGDDYYDDRLTSMDIWTGVIVVAVFILSFILLSFAIANFVKTTKRIKELRAELRNAEKREHVTTFRYKGISCCEAA